MANAWAEEHDVDLPPTPEEEVRDLDLLAVKDPLIAMQVSAVIPDPEKLLIRVEQELRPSQ